MGIDTWDIITIRLFPWFDITGLKRRTISNTSAPSTFIYITPIHSRQLAQGC